jgi:hypothetical protein
MLAAMAVTDIQNIGQRLAPKKVSSILWQKR